MSDVLAEIEGALARKGLSAAKASELAVGNPSFIKNLRNGQGKFSYDNLRRLAGVLGLECYFGPPRHDASRRYDGSFTYSGEPQTAPLSYALRQALRLDEDATELDALARIASLPHSAHRAMEMLQEDARRRQALAQTLAAAQQLLAEALEELAASESTGFAEAPAPAFRDAPAHHAGFAEPAPPAFGPPRRPNPPPDEEKD
jgi:hypothetical protein